jgi:hypothetical protein
MAASTGQLLAWPAFTVNSGSAIAATVPAGATTGKVQVVTAGASLSSNC